MTVNVGAVAFTSLPSPVGNEGQLSGVIDSPVNTFGAIIASGGGPYHVLAYCNGTNWIVSTARQYWFGPVVDRINMLPANPYTAYPGWTLTNITQSTATGVTNPDGTTGPQKFTPTVTNAGHFLTSPTFAPSTTYSGPLKVSVFARADGAITGFGLVFQAGVSQLSAAFDVKQGLAFSTSIAGTWRQTFDGPISSITPYPNGWFRCDLSSVALNVANLTVQFVIGFGNYAGDGVSGIEFWRLSVLPTSAWAFKHRAFFDDFNSISTIDVNDTRAAGFNWYTHNAWPNAVAPWTTAPKTQIGDISVNASVLTLSTDRSGLGEGLNTAADNGSGGFVGQTFYPPMLIESVANFDPSHAIGAGNPAISPVVLMTQDIGFLTANNEPHAEIDVCKANPTGAGTVAPQQTTHDWNTNNTVNNIYQGTAVVGSPTFTQMHRYSALYLTMDANGGQLLFSASTGTIPGWIMYFFDGVATGQDIGYFNFAGASPALTPANPNGAIWGSDLRRAALIIGAGTSWPINIDSVAVYK